MESPAAGARTLTRADRSIDAVFLQAVASGAWDEIRSDYADAVTTLAVTLAANASAAAGGTPVGVAPAAGEDSRN